MRARRATITSNTADATVAATAADHAGLVESQNGSGRRDDAE
jgi:hypothetical protein